MTAFNQFWYEILSLLHCNPVSSCAPAAPSWDIWTPASSDRLKSVPSRIFVPSDGGPKGTTRSGVSAIFSPIPLSCREGAYLTWRGVLIPLLLSSLLLGRFRGVFFFFVQVVPAEKLRLGFVQGLM